MKRYSACALVVAFVLFAGAAGADDVIDSVQKGCEKELETFCADVTPGEGRLLACFYAYGDKLSGSCEYALYDAAAQLERFISALTYLANECGADLEEYCSEVVVGEGRVARCLLDNKSKLSDRCASAVDVTDLQVTDN